MKNQSNRSGVAIIAVLAAAFSAVAVIGYVAITPGATPVADTLDATEAVRLAVSRSADDNRIGGAVEKPLEAFGKVMSLDQAINLVTTQVSGQNATARPDGSRSVWLIALSGKFISRVPPAPPDIPAKIVEHTQMVVILDALSGESIQSTIVSPRVKFDTTSLAKLQIPGDTLVPAIATPLRSPIRQPTAVPVK